jgi:hypothetical protein
MHFKALESRGRSFRDNLQIQAQYGTEVGKEGERWGAMSGLLDRLAKAMRAAQDFQALNKTPQSTELKGVKNLIKFHEGQHSAVKLSRQKELNDYVIYLRKWLSRQGVWFSGDAGFNRKRSTRTVYYDTDLRKQDLTRVRIQGGLLFAHDGKPFDTRKMVTCFSGPGFGIYVMSGEGNLHVGSHSVGHYHHSSLLAGKNVAGAGEIVVREGKILCLSNKSGHYQPSRSDLLNVLAVLQAEHVPLAFKIRLITPFNKGFQEFGTVLAFMQNELLDDESLDKAQHALKIVYEDDYDTSGYMPEGRSLASAGPYGASSLGYARTPTAPPAVPAGPYSVQSVGYALTPSGLPAGPAGSGLPLPIYEAVYYQ